ncbi:fungal-specific transcription factor domain-containing protein [Scheffersomyces coipomensis]|uniref:fungal-specific transcription factor domain-containing protein n=1 Tax=Scheffersomyces coipomensis TaxID=1788519 RepID=UPI00315C5236
MSSIKEPVTQAEDAGNEKYVYRKRSKTFTGCFTCRSRKIRCDLQKPHCMKCIKAGYICSGYDIKLRWSLPIEFKPNKSGNSVHSQVVFKDKDSSNAEGGADSTEFFQRRNVEFVVWDEKKNCKPYETYEEMDKDLGILNNSGTDNLVRTEGKTKLLGPFGVFRGSQTPKRAIASTSVNHEAPKKKQKVIEAASPDRSSVINSTYDTPSSHYSSKRSYATTPTIPLSGSNDSAPHDQLWLSNELRDAALLTAAALNGDTQYLDFMNFPNNNDKSSSHINTNASSSPQQNFNLNNNSFNTNQNDFLNLVFHRNLSNSLGTSNSNNHNNNNHASSAGNASNLSHDTTNMAMSNLLNETETTIDPDNQHLYYSNYNNYYYNNPYQLNEGLEIHLHASSKLQNDDETTDLVDGDQSNSVQMPTSIMSIVQSHTQPIDIDLSIPTTSSSSPKAGLPTTALQVQPLTRYLLNYYITQVADLMTVIPLTENPWKTIYFPRAVMAIGELSALGQTSTAKNALLNALLAVSAFNLQSKFPKNSDSMKYYLNLGIRLRNQASLFVKQLLNSKSDTQASIEHCLSNEKYKDVLCAVMTMISVDLVWGTMQDTSFYINWCGKVIATKMINKKKLSSKARILHRIFSSLKLIQDSTCLDGESIKDDFESTAGRGYDVNGDKFANKSEEMKKGRIDFIVNSTINNIGTNGSGSVNSPSPAKNTSPSFVNKKLINTKKNDENFATDALYGLPNSLIILFSETVTLLRNKIYYKDASTLPKSFDADVTALNKKLLNWNLDWQLYEGQHTSEVVRSLEGSINEDEDLQDDGLHNVDLEAESDARKKFYSPMHEATYHHILSFYHALMIYFYRLIRGVSTHKLQTKVAKTLNHLNSIQTLIARDEAAIIPLFWQGFIAGCEAVSLNLQMGFKKWGADIAQYLGSYWGARQIMLEVWRRKRMNEARDDWVSVIQDWEMNLMLN